MRLTVGKPEVALQAIEFSLGYDPALVSPAISSNTNGEMDVFAAKLPSGWEQMCSHDPEQHKFYLRYAATESGDVLTLAAQIVIEIRFNVIGSGSVVFHSPSSDVIAVPASDPLNILGGTGGSVTAVASSDTEKIGVVLSGGEKALIGGDYPLDITVTNLGDVTGIIAVQFRLEYDKTAFDPEVKTNKNSEMDAFIVQSPDSSWEQMCSLDVSGGVYTLRLAAVNAGTRAQELLSAGGEIKLRVPFKVTGSEGSTAAFTVKTDSVMGVNGLTGIIAGRGDSFRVSLEEKAAQTDPVIPEKYNVDGEFLLGVPEKTDCTAFLSEFANCSLLDADGKEASGYVCTGYKLVCGSAGYTVIVRGDGNGDGEVEVSDYIITKRIVLETYTPSAAQIRALSLSGEERPDTADYIKIKRHVLGTYNINDVGGK